MEKRRKIRLWSLFWIMLVCCVFIFQPGEVQAKGQNSRTVRVAFPMQEGMSYFRTDGTPTGYTYTYMEKLSEYTGWKIEYIPYNSGDKNKDIQDAMEDLESGKVDLFGPLLKNQQTREKYLFPQRSYGTVYTVLYALETSDLREDNAKLLSELRVGLLKDADTRNQEVADYLNSENFNYKLRYYETEEEQYQALLDEEIDVISGVSLSPISGARVVEKFSPRAYYFAASPGNIDLVNELEDAIETLDRVQPSLQEVLYERYFQNGKYVFTLTEKQKKYLSSLGTLRVLCVDNDAPYVYQKDGKPAGMVISVLEDFARKADVSIEYVFCEDREEAEKMISQEHYDLMVGLSFTSRYCAEHGFVRSKSIMESNLAYVHDSDNEKHRKVAVQSGLEDFVDTTDFEETFSCDNALECIKAVKDGDADFAVSDRSSLSYYIYDNYSSLVTSLIAGSTQTICIAIARDSDEQFIRLINDYVYSLSDLQKTGFLEDGNMHEHKTTLISYMRIHPIQVILVFVTVTAFVVVAGFMLFHARRIHKKNEEIWEANQVKSEFLTRMSHDIRTPMNGIIGMLNIADRHIDDPKAVKKYHKKIRMASEYLLSLINDILDMRKMDQNEIMLFEESVNIRDVIENCKDILEAKAGEQDIELNLDGLKEFYPPRVMTSEVHLNQIFMNVIGNAIKYNKYGGKVYVSAVVLDQNADTVACRFSVTDTGIGMSGDFQQQMFDPFTQEHGENRSEFKGTGLGLSIVKRIVEQMGGKILVESEKDIGTKFSWDLTFAIDKDYDENKKIIPEKKVSLNGIHVLAAEDNSLNSEILKFLLEDMGMKVELVENGQRAVDVFRESRPGEYDLILMDIMMPVMNGYEACQKIRSMDRPDASKIPIIALTANAFAEDIARSAEAGMDAHITKPINENKLKECMLRLLASR